MSSNDRVATAIPGTGESCAPGGRASVATRAIFKGFALNPVDAKGRVAIPLPFRKQIEANSGERSVVVSRHPERPCLTAYDESWSQELYARIDRRQQAQADAGQPIDDDILRTLMTNAESATYDDSGRFILPPYFREAAGIKGLAFFAGNAATFEIWNPETLIASPEISQLTRDTCRWHLDNRGAK